MINKKIIWKDYQNRWKLEDEPRKTDILMNTIGKQFLHAEEEKNVKVIGA